MKTFSLLLLILLIGATQGASEESKPLAADEESEFESPHRETLQSWTGIREIIEKSRGNDFFGSFSDVNEIQYVTTNQITPSCSFRLDWSKEHKKQYSDWASKQWLKWWDKTGQAIAKNRRNNGEAFPKAWHKANELTQNFVLINPVPKIWKPKEWTLSITFKTGDYGAMEKERWIIHCSEKQARVYRIKANVWGRRPLSIQRCSKITKSELNHYLAIVTYVYEYQLRNPNPVQINKIEKKNASPGYYYPHGSIRLDSKGQSIWHLKGFEHYYYPHQYSSRDLSSSEPQPASDYHFAQQKAGLARSIAKALWDSKEWKTVFELGEFGRQLVRGTLQESVFNKVDGDIYSFAAIAVSGGDKDAILIETAILQAERIDNNQGSYLDLVTKNGFTSKDNKYALTFDKKLWKLMLDYIRGKQGGKPTVIEDVMMNGNSNRKKFKFLEFEFNGRSSLRIPIGTKK